MELVRDVLDAQLVDRNNRKMGRCDGLVIEIGEGVQPRVAFIEVGAVTLCSRLHPRLGEWAARAARRWGLMRSDPFRIPWSKAIPARASVVVGVDAEKSDALAWERKLRAKVIGRIPGA